MRDSGRVHLPEIITKSGMLQDLEFLGFVAINESVIHDDTAKRQSFVRCNDTILKAQEDVAKLQQELEDVKMRLFMEKIALICFHKGNESFENEVAAKAPWSYKGTELEAPTSANIDETKHFYECSSKLGLDVSECRPSFV
ncbi:MAG: hypothetical protein SGBAC_002462 [Bacillariaceae sp.]